MSQYRSECPHPSPCWCKECRRAYQRAYVATRADRRNTFRRTCKACSLEFSGPNSYCAACSACRATMRNALRMIAASDKLAKLESKPPKPSCFDCGISVSSHQVARCRACYIAARKASAAPAARVCTCGQPIKPRCRICSDCATRNNREAKARIRHRYRLRRTNARHEPYTLREIAERDNWRCALCRKKVSSRVCYPHPLSGSIDHIVPLSRGGDDVPANVQLAHFRCNASKGSRGKPEQLRLI